MGELKREFLRQSVHISGILFILIAQFVNPLIISAAFLVIAATLLFWSWYIKKIRERMNIFSKMEMKLRSIAFKLERENNPQARFMGAFWFFFSGAFILWLFPLPIASAALFILCIGDGLATVVGKLAGRHKWIGKKTIEGSIAFFLGSLVAMVFLPFYIILIAAIFGAIIEGITDIVTRRHWWIDDNLTVSVLIACLLSILL